MTGRLILYYRDSDLLTDSIPGSAQPFLGLDKQGPP